MPPHTYAARGCGNHIGMEALHPAMIVKWELTIPELTGDEPRRAYVYVPDWAEEERSLRFPVLYMFDGHNVFFDEDATYGKSWGLADYLDDGDVPLIVAAVESNRHPNTDRLSEYSPFSFQSDRYGKVKGRGRTTMEWFVNVFKPEIDEKFPTLPDREHTFVAGSSMGGLMSLYAVLKYNKVFSRAAALSPSLWVDREKLEKLIRTVRVRRDTVLYMDYGQRELPNNAGMEEDLRRAVALLMERRLLLSFRIVPGGSHSEESWERQAPFFINTLMYGLE